MAAIAFLVVISRRPRVTEGRRLPFSLLGPRPSTRNTAVVAALVRLTTSAISQDEATTGLSRTTNAADISTKAACSGLTRPEGRSLGMDRLWPTALPPTDEVAAASARRVLHAGLIAPSITVEASLTGLSAKEAAADPAKDVPSVAARLFSRTLDQGHGSHAAFCPRPIPGTLVAPWRPPRPFSLAGNHGALRRFVGLPRRDGLST